MVPQREHRERERDAECDPGQAEREHAGRGAERRRRSGGEEGQGRRAAGCGQPGERRRQDLRRQRPSVDGGTKGEAARDGVPLHPGGAARCRGPAQCRRERLGRRAAPRVERERAVDCCDDVLRQPGAHRGERRRASLDRSCALERGGPPERMAAGEPFPEQHAHGPDVGCGSGSLAGESLGRDVRQRPRHIAHRRQRVCRVELGEAEVEDADLDTRAFAQEHVRGLDVAVDDSARVRVGEAVENLRRSLERRLVVDPPLAHCLAERASGDVLVRDVDVIAVASDAVAAEAPLVAETSGGDCLALGPRTRLPLPCHDLQCDVEPGRLIPGEPDGAGGAAPERSKRPIPTDDEVLARARCGCYGPLSHPGRVSLRSRHSCPDRRTG